MRSRSACVCVGLFVLAIPACGTSSSPDAKPAAKGVAALKNEIPADQLDAVARAHFRGLGFMERYEYRKAVEAFREVHDRAPGWIPGSINLAIALLNDTGSRTENPPAQGGAGAGSGLSPALTLLDEVIARDPANLNARYCRGLILEFLGQERTAEANKDFRFVAEHDPTDGHAWFKVGVTMTAPGNPVQNAGPDEAAALIELYSKALDRNPYLVTALYKLQQAYGWAGQGEKQAQLLERWRALNPKTSPAGPGETAEAFYGENGKYARVINPFQADTTPRPDSPAPRFELPAPIRVTLAEGDRWVGTEDFTVPLAVVGRVRSRFGATIAAFDADGDGRADLVLAAAIRGPGGVRDALLLNRGEGTYDEVSRSWGLPDDFVSLGAAAADFDADGRIDLVLTGASGYRVLRNVGGKRFEDITARAGLASPRALCLTGALARPRSGRRPRPLPGQLHRRRTCRACVWRGGRAGCRQRRVSQ